MKFNGIVGAGILVALIVAVFGLEREPLRPTQLSEPTRAESFLEASPREAVAVNKSTNVQTLQQLATVTYVGADKGHAVIWDEAVGVVHRLVTSRPVFRAFGISLSRRTLLYSPLENGIPSGVLLVEDLDSGESTRVTDDLIVEAIFSADASKVAYTFATGAGFGLASIDLHSKIKKQLIGHDVLPDYLQWDASGNDVLFFTIRNNQDVGELVPQRMSLAGGKASAVPRDSLPATFPKSSSYSSDRQQSLSQIEPGHFEINYPFEVNSPDKTKTVCSSNLLGNNPIRLCGDAAGDANLSTGQLLKITNYGIILRRFHETRTTTDFVDWGGNTITLAASAEVAFNLPMSPNNGSFVVTRSGAGYGTQACTIVGSLHTGSLEFAFDMQKQSAGHHVIASADGLAMNPVRTINCNSCADLPNGCGGKPHCSTSQANGGWGNTVLIQHADTTWTRYAHLQANSVTVEHGASVCRGLYIGNQGGTGTSCGSFNGCGDHLHFQKQLSASGASVAVSFADAAVNPLRCISHTSGSAELSACSVCQNGTATLRNRDGGPPIHPPGSLLKSSSNQTVFLIDSDNRKRPITSAGVLAQLYNQSTDARSSTNFTNWVITVGQDELDLYEQGGNLSAALPGNGKPFPDGKLISFDGQVSIVTGGGKRRPFSDGGRFQALGYSFCNVVNVSQAEYNSYPVGPDVDAMALLTFSLNLNPGGPYTTGQSITGSFSIKNVGYSSISFTHLGVGGRFNSDPFDLSFESITLSAGATRNFNSQPPKQLTSPGAYNFFASYREPNDHWVISVPAAPGVIRSRQINVENGSQLSTPTASPATNVTINSFTANWTTANGATGYRLDVSLNSSFSTFVTGYQNRDVGNVLSGSVTGLASGTTYFYRVRAYNGSNTSSNSNVISTTTANNPGPSNNNFASPQVISGMLGTVTGTNSGANKESGEPNHANNSGGASVWYRWQAPVTSSVTFATTGSNFDTLLAAYTGSSVGALTLVTGNDDFNGGVQSAITFNAQSGVTYHIAVDGFSGATGNIVLGWGQTPAPPLATQASNVTTSSFTANWNSVTGASGYELDVSTSNTFSSFVSGFQNLDVGNVLSRNVTGLSADTTYFYRVRAYNSAGTSNNSNTISAKTNGTVPPAPVAGAATNVTTSSLTANWNSATGATGYRLDVSTNNTFSSFVPGFQNLDVGNVLSRNVNGLSAGTTYFYRVRAYNNAGTSANSNTISAATPTQTFTISVTASPSNGGVVSGEGTFAAGSSRTVTATANPTHIFANWTEGGVAVSTSSTFTFVLNANRSLVANFTAIPISGNATYDSILRVPKCGQVGSTCDSGGLLNGRDSISGGQEPNQPNTLFNSCADNTSGIYHNDESIDRIKISTLDGGPLAPGKTIKIDVTVWAFSVTNDFLDLFYTSDVNNPNWTLITTLIPSGTGSQVLSATFTIPNSGGVHAIRANFLLQGAPVPCSGGPNNFDDHDDLAFAVQQPSGPSWQPTILTANQVELKSWKVDGRTFVYAKLTFPDAGYRVANWGSLSQAGNAFAADATIEKFTGGSAQVITSNAQIWDLGALAVGTYSFTFKNSGTNVKTLNITVSSTPPAPNPIDDAREFVFWQYKDFLRRDPDGPGWDHWTAEITQCTNIAFRRPGESEAQCVERKRENTSAAFFVSPESQNIAYFVLRVYRGSLGRMPFFGGGNGPSDEFTRDAATVGAGIVVNNALDHNVINSNKQAFVNAFVLRSDFKAIYDPLTNTQYVDRLFQTTGVTPSAGDRQALINGLNGGETRASVLFKVVDGTTTGAGGLLTFNTTYGKAFYDNLFNAAFVQMEYFGYLQRDPDPGGYAFWLGKLNTFGDWVNAEMVKSFIKAPEYRARFGAP